MRFESTCVFFGLLAVVSAAPKRKVRSASTPAPWHLPCGEVIELGSYEDSEQELKSILNSLKLQHQLTLQDYLNRDYEYLYDRVRIGVHEHQYIPNWVPGKKDSGRIRKLSKSSPQTIANHLPKLHMDLQKFAVAFEELIEDEPSSKTQEALKATQSYLMMMLCEVESSIAVLPSLRLPSRVERSVMNSIERDPEDDTRRLVRDWGVLLKYKDYLHAWRHVFDY
ncbi:hypothetical protein KPH14_006546 [Odynerus spinipes]|uniref:Uncharacterized protein n=1 Tax=Odynerus spinipes TaxID=1348599 RepID=A0AAD9VRH1_9HYME|nr:hypothetical protein KPH14_006546 [Odynerus spinipes]